MRRKVQASIENIRNTQSLFLGFLSDSAKYSLYPSAAGLIQTAAKYCDSNCAACWNTGERYQDPLQWWDLSQCMPEGRL